MLRLCPIFFLVIANTILLVESNSWCNGASLGTTEKKLIHDCDLVNDKLHLELHRITGQTSCVNNIKLNFGRLHPPAEVSAQTGKKHQITVTNPLEGANRCQAMTIYATVTFASSKHTWEKYLDFEVNPFESKCFYDNYNTYKPTANIMTIDLAQKIPMKLWYTCIHSVEIEDKHFPDPSRPFRKSFEIDLCKDTQALITYNFNGIVITKHKEIITFLKNVHQFGGNPQLIEHCDILEEDFNIAINRMISRPECNTRTYVKVGNQQERVYYNGVGQAYEKRENPLNGAGTGKSQCFKTEVTVETKMDQIYMTTTFELDPLKCFKAIGDTRVAKSDERSVAIDITEVVATNQRLFEKCFKDLKIFTHNKSEVQYEMLLGLINITTLDRLENVNLTVVYIFEGGFHLKSKTLFVPYSKSLVQRREEQEWKKEEKLQSENFHQNVILPIGATSGGVILLLLLVVLTVVCVHKRKAKAEKTTNYNTDENHTYGTYATGDDGEYEYDVAEVVDNNELYGGVGGAETHDNNEYYQT